MVTIKGDLIGITGKISVYTFWQLSHLNGNLVPLSYELNLKRKITMQSL